MGPWNGPNHRVILLSLDYVCQVVTREKIEGGNSLSIFRQETPTSLCHRPFTRQLLWLRFSMALPGGVSHLHQTDRGLKPSLVAPRDVDSVKLIYRQLHCLSRMPMTNYLRLCYVIQNILYTACCQNVDIPILSDQGDMISC